jgi:hypothetical protein
MAYKRIDPNLLEVEAPSTAPEGNTYTDFAKTLAKSAIKAPFQAIELPVRALDYATDLVSGKSSNNIYPSHVIEKALGPSKEPESVVGKAINYSVGNWPLFYGGAITPAAVGKDLFSSLSIAGAQEAGFGPAGQLAASVLSGKGFDKALNKVKGVKDIDKVGLFKQGLYDQEKKIGSKIPVSSDKLVKGIDDIISNTNKKLVSDYGFTQSTKNGVISNLSAIKDRLSKPDLKASDVFEANKALNEIYSPKKSISGGIYKHTKSLIQSELDNVYKGKNKRNKLYADVAKGANELHQIENWNTGLSNWAKSLDEVGSLKKIVSGVGATALGLLTHGVPGAKAGAALTIGAVASKYGAQGAHEIARAGRFINSLRKTPDGQKLLLDIAADSAKGATSAITKNMLKFNKLANQYQDADESTQVNPEDLEFI